MVNPSAWPSKLARLLILAAGLGSLAACGEEAPPTTSPGTGDPRLIVIPEVTTEEMFGAVSATLGVNDKNCFVVDDTVLVVGKGSRVVDAGSAVDISGVGTVRVGEEAAGAGGIIEGTTEVENFVDSLGLDDAVMDCQEDVEAPKIVILDPSG